MPTYTHKTYGTGFADVVRDGQIVRITHGDPQFDAINARMNRHLEESTMGYDNGGYYYGSQRPKKKWRYPDVPIPYRLQHIYAL